MHKSVRYALLASAIMASPAAAQPQSSAAPAAASKPARASFVPANFNPPTLAQTAIFKLVPFGPALAKVDFAAYMSSIDHLQKTFSRSTNWPTKGISDADAIKDMEGEQAKFKGRRSFDYSVLTPDGRRERGSVYVSPSPVPGYDAVVRLWVTQAEYDAGFDAVLYKWVADWVRKDWPFAKVAYPGRSIDWKTWDAMVAANTPKKPAP